MRWLDCSRCSSIQLNILLTIQLAVFGFLMMVILCIEEHSPSHELSLQFLSYHSHRPTHAYKYKRSNITDCYIHQHSLKYLPTCGQDAVLKPKYIKQLLVVAVQRSGTHYMWEMLQSIGIDVHHEGVGPDGAVSWLYAVNSHYNSTPYVEDIGRGYVINNPEALHKNRFRWIFHQVRHPLRVISTLLRRCSEWDSIWAWIHSLRGFEEISSELTPLHRSMLLYWLWNRHIEVYADLRYQSELTSAEEVCQWAGFGERCNHRPQTRTQLRRNDTITNHAVTNSSTGSASKVLRKLPYFERLGVNWAKLTAENASLTLQLQHMCRSYGYALDPARTPQRPETRRYTA